MRHLAIFLLCATSIFSVEFVCHYDQFLHNGISELQESLSWPYTITSFHFQSDFSYTQEECSYVTGFKPGSVLTRVDFEKGLSRLFATKHFSFLSIHMGDHELLIEATGAWRLQKVRVTGFHFDKDTLKSFYLIEPGERFDYKKHLMSLEHIKNDLLKSGYAAVQVSNDISYDYEHKLVSVSLTIDKGKRFKVARSKINLHADECTEKEKEQILQQLARIAASMQGTYWSSSLALEKAHEFKHVLRQAGFFQHEIYVSKKIDTACHKIDIDWDIEIHSKRQFVFFGNVFFSDAELLDQLLSLGSAVSFLSENLLQQELLQFYRQKGFFHIEIMPHEEEHRIVFVINEHKRAIIKEITIEGESLFSEKELRYLLKKINRHPFDHIILERALEQIKTKYKKIGYYNTSVDYFMRHLNDKDIALGILIKEGQPTVVNYVQVPGYEKLEAYLHKKWPIPQSYTPELLRAQRVYITEWCAQHGITYTVISPSYNTDSLIWQIINTSSRVGKVIISGTDDPRVRTLIACKEGDTWSEKAIQHTFKQLKRLNVFDTIQLVPGKQNDERDLIVFLRKDDPFELKVRVGIELQDIQKYQSISGITYKLGGTFLIKDPFLSFDQLRFDANFTRVHREIVGRYDRPVLCIPGLNTALQLYSIKHDQPFVHTPDDIYTLKQHGGLLGLSYQIFHVDTGCNVGFEWMETEIDRDKKELMCAIARAILFDPTLLDRRVPFIFFEPIFIADYVDNHLDPHYGSLTLITAKTMIPLNRQKETIFLKILAEQTIYYPFGSVVGAFRLRFGHIFHREFSAIMPSERFYLGGAFSLRSYDTDLAPPLGEFIDRKGKCVAVPQGGKSMVNANIEFRIPLVNQMNLVLFQDLGFLSCNDFADVCFDSILLGTGFGLRYATPVGPLRFDLGFKWRNDIPNQQSFSWFLSIGQAF